MEKTLLGCKSSVIEMRKRHFLVKKAADCMLKSAALLQQIKWIVFAN